jgi:hypothetical protein
VGEFDLVCDDQARSVVNSAAASQRHAAGLAEGGIAPPDGDDSPVSGDVGGVPARTTASDHPTGRLAVSTRAAPSRKGKEKVGGSGANDETPVPRADETEPPIDPANDLVPRAGRGKRPAESSPDHAVWPPKRASRVVQYVVSSDEDVSEEPVFAGTKPDAGVSAGETLREAEDAGASRQAEDVRGFDAPVAPHSDPSDPLKDAGEHSFAAEAKVDGSVPAAPFVPGNFAPSSSAGPSGPFPSAAHPGGVRGEPSFAQNEPGEGSGFVTLSDFTPTEILNHLIHNDVYFGKGWGEVKEKSVNSKMEFFFNCHTLVSFLLGCFLFGLCLSS